MNLAVDVGNSRTKLAVFDGVRLVAVDSVASDVEDIIEELSESYGIKQCIISTVRSERLSLRSKEIAVFRLGEDELEVPMKIDYETVHTLGNDRIAAAVGAAKAFPGRAILVVDAGTCVTYDFISADGAFRGGNIAPGLSMRLRAMHEQTGKLPKVAVRQPMRVVGKSTDEAMLNGAALGIDYEIEGYQRYFASEFEELMTVITGGDAEYFAERSKTEIFVRPNLVVQGLNEILKVNAG